MKVSIKILAVVAILMIATGLLAVPVSALTVPRGMPVNLVFDQGLNSKTAQVGEAVRLHVANDVMVGDRTVIKAGTPVSAVVTKVKHRKRYGVNARLMLYLNPVMSTYGVRIPLREHEAGKSFGGRKSGEAAGATVGGAILLGPVGLVGGYFITGKQVKIHPGDALPTEVLRTTMLKMHRKR